MNNGEKSSVLDVPSWKVGPYGTQLASFLQPRSLGDWLSDDKRLPFKRTLWEFIGGKYVYKREEAFREFLMDQIQKTRSHGFSSMTKEAQAKGIRLEAEMGDRLLSDFKSHGLPERIIPWMQEWMPEYKKRMRLKGPRAGGKARAKKFKKDIDTGYSD